jgi:hypothetical protein
MANGQARLTLPQYIFGPAKARMQTPTILDVDLPQASKMTIHVLRVSDFSALRVIVDKDPKVDFAISALPGAADQERVEQRDPGLYQAVINKDYSLEVPAGKHTIELKNVGGDWVSIASVTFAGAKSSRYADLDLFALQDASCGETIAWLRNQESGWYNDLQGKAPRTIDGATIKIPVKQPGEYKVQWWDTRTGEVIREDRVTDTDGALRLQIPRVERDIALRAIPPDERAEAK